MEMISIFASVVSGDHGEHCFRFLGSFESNRTCHLIIGDAKHELLRRGAKWNSGVGDAVAAATRAADHEIVDLSGFGMKQHRSAISTAIVNGVRAGDQDRWSINDRTLARNRNHFQMGFRMLWILPQLSAHATLRHRRERERLSVTDACHIA